MRAAVSPIRGKRRELAPSFLRKTRVVCGLSKPQRAGNSPGQSAISNALIRFQRRDVFALRNRWETLDVAGNERTTLGFDGIEWLSMVSKFFHKAAAEQFCLIPFSKEFSLFHWTDIRL